MQLLESDRSSALRARVHLLYSLPVGSSVNADALALTLIARRESFDRWVAGPAGSTLPSRRMAAIILERAAREVVRSTECGDPGPLARFMEPPVQASYKLLLADREPLVWRHAAIARGLLSAVDSRLREEIDLDTARRYADLGVHRLALLPRDLDSPTYAEELIERVGETVIGKV